MPDGGDKSQFVRHERAAVLLQRLLDHRVAPAFDRKVERAVHVRAHVVGSTASIASADATSRLASACAACLIGSADGRQTLVASFLEDFQLQAERAVGAFAILVSSAASSVVVNRTWPARVWRWMNVALSGATVSFSPCCAVTSMK